MITPKCNICEKELNEFGAILLSPPDGTSVNKYHICVFCYERDFLPKLTVETEWPDIDEDL